MIATVSEVIDLLRKEKPDETLVITWWGESDFTNKKDRDQALQLADDALDNCVGHVNDYVQSQYEEE